jgi:hypothetical protein
MKNKIFNAVFGSAILSIGINAFAVAPAQVEQVSPSQIYAGSNNYIIKNKDFESSLPKSTLDWLEMIKKKNPELNCPQFSNESICNFLSHASLEYIGSEYGLVLRGESFAEGFLDLPEFSKVASQSNNSNLWFKKVLLNGKETEIIEKNGNMLAKIDKGDFELKIILSKNVFKELNSIQIEQPILVFNNLVKEKDFIKEGKSIRVIQKISEPTSQVTNEDDKKNLNQELLQVNVYRKIVGTIPNLLSTKIKVIYSGSPKDVYLGKIIPEGFEFTSASSSLKVDKKEDGFWVKLVAGEHEINIESFILKNIDSLKVKDLVKFAENEVWSLEQNSAMRQIEIMVAQQIDPSQANVPNQWRGFPSYLVLNEFEMKTNRRGIEENKNLKMSVQRTSFFGFDDNKMNHTDTIKISNYGVPFLSKTLNDINIESFRINDQNQVLVSNAGTVGLVIPKGDFSASSQSSSTSTSTGLQFWDGSLEQLTWNVNLAPRNKMFAAFGDSIKSSGTWWDNWNLYTIFSVFIIVLAFYKLFGKVTSGMALIGILMFQGEIFSWILWLTILLVLGLLKVLPNSSKESDFTKYVEQLGIVSLFLLVIYSLDFIKAEIQLIINPSLEVISGSLHFIDSSDFLYHALILLLISIFVFSPTKVKVEGKSKRNFLNWKFIFGICIVGYLGVMSLSFISAWTTGTRAIVSSMPEGKMLRGIEPSASTMEMESQDMVASAPSAYSSLSKSRNFDKKEMVNNIVLKKAQVGSGVPHWGFVSNDYTIRSNGAIDKEDKIDFWIAPVWLVNIFSVGQIIFLIISIFVFSIGLLHLSNNEKWFEKIPVKLRDNKFVRFLLLNDLQKGLTK